MIFKNLSNLHLKLATVKNFFFKEIDDILKNMKIVHKLLSWSRGVYAKVV